MQAQETTYITTRTSLFLKALSLSPPFRLWYRIVEQKITSYDSGRILLNGFCIQYSMNRYTISLTYKSVHAKLKFLSIQIVCLSLNVFAYLIYFMELFENFGC